MSALLKPNPEEIWIVVDSASSMGAIDENVRFIHTIAPLTSPNGSVLRCDKNIILDF